jgi:uncharacterized protein YutD
MANDQQRFSEIERRIGGLEVWQKNELVTRGRQQADKEYFDKRFSEIDNKFETMHKEYKKVFMFLIGFVSSGAMGVTALTTLPIDRIFGFFQ